MPPRRLATKPDRPDLSHDEPPDVMMASGPAWNSAYTSSPSPTPPYSSHLSRPQTLYGSEYHLAQSYQSFPYPPVPVLTPERHFGYSARSFSSLASITPTPSPPSSEYCHMMDMSEDERSRSREQAEDWRNVDDKFERRKIQNRNAQRKHRSKQRREDEERARIADNQHAAGSAYTAPNPDELEAKDPSGLPWGSVPIKQVFEAGRAAAREKSQQTSREGSTSVGGSSASMHAGGSTRQGGPFQRPYAASSMGLLLSERWARGPPAWEMLRRNYRAPSTPSDPGGSGAATAQRRPNG